jgi:hypothetical protein
MHQDSASPLLSKRGQNHLQQLHRNLIETGRTADRALSSLLAAVQACDAATQHEYFCAYCDELAAHQRALKQIMAFIEHRFQNTSIADAMAETSAQPSVSDN